MNSKEVIDYIEANYPGEEVIVYDEYAEAFIGIGYQQHNPIAIYDRDKALECLIDDETDYESAAEHFSFNTQGAWLGNGTPIFISLNEL
jgi:hypothetical protein